MDLQQMLPPGGIEALAAQLGIPREQAARGAQALLPALVGGMGDRAGGIAAADAQGLETHVNALGGAGLADNVIGDEPTEITKGNQLLGGIFGSKEVSRQVADHTSQSSGLDPALLRKMLPILAMLAAGYMSKRAGGQAGGLGGILSSVLGGMAGGGLGGGGLGGAPGGGASRGGQGPLGSGLGSILGSVLGGRH